MEPKAESESSLPAMTKCKKSSSTGTGSKRWNIRYLLKRSNSEGKEHPMVLLTPKKVDSPKAKKNSGELISKSRSQLKAQSGSRNVLSVNVQDPCFHLFPSC
ncbi:hypothetical protein CTI12_AA582190 [Artemisia annua]|uniref:Uncharacterized protein n=1 Tax=Artemisia annua TaxID=35608 RepID=A0A2U1KNJ1_ARTAN|nr:hypothetical protein CTI12_AA582190 [Artemisia annua]